MSFYKKTILEIVYFKKIIWYNLIVYIKLGREDYEPNSHDWKQKEKTEKK